MYCWKIMCFQSYFNSKIRAISSNISVTIASETRNVHMLKFNLDLNMNMNIICGYRSIPWGGASFVGNKCAITRHCWSSPLEERSRCGKMFIVESREPSGGDRVVCVAAKSMESCTCTWDDGEVGVKEGEWHVNEKNTVLGKQSRRDAPQKPDCPAISSRISRRATINQQWNAIINKSFHNPGSLVQKVSPPHKSGSARLVSPRRRPRRAEVRERVNGLHFKSVEILYNYPYEINRNYYSIKR